MSDIVEHDVEVGNCRLHLRSVHGGGTPILIAHGWPESSVAWVPVLERAARDGAEVHAVDLPGVAGSTRGSTGATKREIAAVLGELARTQGWDDACLVGHDCGGMVAYAALRTVPLFTRVAICNTVIPGVPPWDAVYTNAAIFHFHLHAVPDLPERLVAGRERAYFDWFLDFLTDDPSRITEEYRAAFAEAYSTPEALTTGFDWYRTMPQDAEENAADTGPVGTPLLYIRGDADPVEVEAYLAGFRSVGVQDVRSAVVPHSGHSSSLESPDALWATIRDFARS